MLIYFLIFLFIIFLYFLSLGQKVEEAVLVILLGAFFVFFAGLRGDGVSRDYDNYKETFKGIRSFSEYFQFTYIEPAYYFFPALLKGLHIFSFPLIFTIYSFLGVTLKIKVIFRYSGFLLLSMLVYYSQYFLLHEMTQIRIGVAAGFLLLSLQPLRDRRWRAFSLYMLAAMLFHYSAIIFCVVVFLKFDYLNKKLYLAMLAGSIVLGVLNYDLVNLLAGMNLGIFSQKLDNYIGAQAEGLLGTGVNKFNIINLINIALALLFVIKSEVVQENNKYGYILIKLFVIANMSFYLFSNFIVFAWRLSELFGIVQILLFPCLVYIFKPRWIGVTLLFLVSFLVFYANVYHSKLLNPYF